MVTIDRARSGLAATLGLGADKPANHDGPCLQLALASLIAVGFAMRIFNIGDYGLNFDEAQFVWVAAADTLGQVWELETARSPHPPAAFFLVHWILQFSWDPFWLRLPMVLCGTLLIPATYAFGRQLIGWSAGLTLAALVTFSPAMVELSRACRNYTPGFLLLVLSLLFLVGFVRTGKRRALVISGGAAALAVPWHYALLVPFGAMGLVLAGALLSQRARLRCWLVAAACQAPMVAVFGFLYWRHVSRLPDMTIQIHKTWHSANLGFSLGHPIGPLNELWGYLAPAATAFPLTLLSLAGAVVLVLRRRWLALAVCGAPLLAAYAFMAHGDLPLGGSRHSAYLFPFVFGLVAAHAPELIEGYRSCVAPIARRLARTRPVELPSPIPGVLIATLLVGVFAANSLAEYAADRPEYVLQSGTAYGSELLTYYTHDRIERSFALIEERARPDDLVLLNIQGLFALRMRLRLTPLVRPTLQQQQSRDIRLTWHQQPLRTVHNGVTYYYSLKLRFQPTPTTLRAGLDEVRATFDLPEPVRLWTVRNGWERSIARSYPHLAFDREVDRVSEGWVLAIPARRLPRSAANR